MSVFNPLGLVFSEAFGGSWGFMGADDTFINFSLFWVANHSENCEICLRILSVCFIEFVYIAMIATIIINAINTQTSISSRFIYPPYEYIYALKARNHTWVR